MEHLIVDTDPGIDDAAALFFLLGSPGVQIDLITTVFGNVAVDQATRNAHRLLTLAGRTDIPVHTGAPRPLHGGATFARQIHGDDGLGNLAWPDEETPQERGGAVAAILGEVERRGGDTTILALGPLTNIAIALAEHPPLARGVKQIVCMGGAVLTMGNASPVASANFFNDPWAAAVVYESGAAIVQVGLDVCQKVSFTGAQIERLRTEGAPAARRFAEMSRFIGDAYRRTPEAVKRWSRYGAEGRVYFNDVPAAGYVLVPDAFTGERLPVVVETDGACRGQTVADFRGQLGREPNATVLLDVDGAGVADLWLERVLSLGRGGDARQRPTGDARRPTS